MSLTIHVNIVSAEAAIFHGNATLVIATGEMGELGITPRHAPLITLMKPGPMEVMQADGERQQFYISGGILEVQPETVTVLADTAVRAADLDEAAAQKAKQEAEDVLSARVDTVEMSQAQVRLAQAQAQLQALSRMRRYLKQ